MKRTNKGFTLIELLVVIAIIGILSSVVLASLTTARSKGTNAAVQNELSNMRAQAELYYSTTGNNQYAAANGGTTCTQASSLFVGTNSLSGLLAGVIQKAGAANVTCAASTTDWAVQALVNNTYFCVDSTGKSTTSASALIAGGHCN